MAEWVHEIEGSYVYMSELRIPYPRGAEEQGGHACIAEHSTTGSVLEGVRSDGRGGGGRRQGAGEPGVAYRWIQLPIGEK